MCFEKGDCYKFKSYHGPYECSIIEHFGLTSDALLIVWTVCKPMNCHTSLICLLLLRTMERKSG